MLNKAIVITAIVLGVTMVLPAAAACRQDGDSQICGSGRNALRLIKGSVSPDGHLAVGWQAKDDNGKIGGVADYIKIGDPDRIGLGARNILVRLPQGKITATLKDDYWDINGRRPKHNYEDTYWSPNSRWMIQSIYFAKQTDSAFLYEINPNGAVVGEVDLLKSLQDAVKKDPPTADGEPITDRNILITIESPNPVLANNGGLTAILQLTDGNYAELGKFSVVMKLTGKGKDLKLGVVSSKFTALDAE